ncbi:MAG TPA: DUF3085 domain-containing protein [Dongiaceae bacterium]|jgi:hypothetical protein|nr:DUF3085 domain-containing protein [Dongiaceae bacterium]
MTKTRTSKKTHQVAPTPSATQLRFDPKEVRALIEVARSAKTWKASFSDCLNPDLRKPGATPDVDGYVDPVFVDTSKIGPKLWLVKDEGCYLMANAAHQIRSPEDCITVCYADGFGPNTPQEELRAVLGGVDFVEALDIEAMERAAAEPSLAVVIRISSETIEISSELHAHTIH